MAEQSRGIVRPAMAGARRPFFRRRKTCPFSGPGAQKIDHKDVKLMQRFVSERGKIVPSRITAVSTRNSGNWRARSNGPVSGATALCRKIDGRPG